MAKQFSIHKSNDLDSLITLLEKFYLMNKGPFQTEPIVVYTQGIEQYIQKKLSKNLGIVANLDFHRPGAFFWYIAQQCIPELKFKNNLFQPEIIRWKLLALLMSSEFQTHYPKSYQAIHHYIDKHQIAPYDLARELASLFSHYMVYRPNWIKTWSNNELVANINGEEQVWQKELWLYLRKELKTYHRVEVWSELTNLLQQPQLPAHIHLPKRVNLFGITSLAPLYLNLIELLSHHIPVHLFVLSPCQEDWSTNPLNHPLLESLGYQGQDFFKILLNYSAILEQDLYHPNNTPKIKINLLSQIQNDILCLNTPSDVSTSYPDVVQLSSDDSITIQAAHSPVRELQILKNYLIQYLEVHPDIKLEEIAVLSPNIEQYLPYIDGIFGPYCPDLLPFNYAVSDIKVKKDQPYYSAISSILQFIASRFEVDAVLDLLNNDCIKKKFEISTRDVTLIHYILKQLNISWGLDQAHRQRYHANNDQFTWTKGMNNLMTLIDENTSQDSLFNFKQFCLGFNPRKEEQVNTQIEIKELVVNKLMPLFVQLKSIYQNNHEHDRSVDDWIKHLTDISLTLIHIDADNEITQKNFFEQLTRLHQNTRLAGFTALINYGTFKYIIESSVNTSSEAGFYSKGITFASLMPMRTIPFKVVALIGLNDQSFPRRNIHNSFDLIQKNRLPGDLSRREDDRYLFLETLVSVQQTLYISFIGRSLEKNEALNPSPLLYELLDLIANMTRIERKKLEDEWIIQHPLQAFSSKYFTKANKLVNYRNGYLKAYQHTKDKDKENNFLAESIELKTADRLILFSDFLCFWHNPARYWLNYQLDLEAPRTYSESTFDEPFSLLRDTSTDAYHVSSNSINQKGVLIVQTLFNGLIQKKPLEDIRQVLHTLDYLPSGNLADTWFEQISSQFKSLMKTRINEDHRMNYTIAELLCSPRSNLKIELNLGNTHITEEFENIFDNQLILFNYQNTLSTHSKIKAYLSHLLRASQGDSASTYLLGLSKYVHIKAMDTTLAQRLLQPWLDYWHVGIEQPLPFFHYSSFRIAQQLNKTKNPLSIDDVYAMQNILEDSYDFDDFENQLLFTNAQSLTQHEHFLPIIQQLIVPMLDHLNIVEVAS